MRKVLDVGQCDADHSRITELLQKNFDVEIKRAHSQDDVVSLVNDSEFDLILINRLLDLNGNAGMDVLRWLKSNESTKSTPTMIVSNYEEAQQQAVAEGAVNGFGKSALDAPSTQSTLAEYLGE